MLISYPEAARAKLCGVESVIGMVSSGDLSGDDVFVVWDEAFEQWTPQIPTQRVVHALNQRRFDARAMLKPVSSKPVPEMHDRTTRFKKSMHGYDWFVVPVNLNNIHLLLRSQDGYHDAQVWNPREEQELIGWLNAGNRLYQARVGLSPDAYAGKNLHPSELITMPSACALTGATEESVLESIKSNQLDSATYQGVPVLVMNKEYEAWEARVAARHQESERAGTHYGQQPEEGFLLGALT